MRIYVEYAPYTHKTTDYKYQKGGENLAIKQEGTSMRNIIAICLLALATNVHASPYNCSFVGGKLAIDSVNKKFIVNDESYDIGGAVEGGAKTGYMRDYLGTYTQPVLKDGQNIRYIWAINKNGQTFFVTVAADNFQTIKTLPAQCDPQETPDKSPDIIPPQIASLVKTVTAADGYITKEIHDSFWNELRKILSQDELKKAVPTLKLQLIYEQKYQEALWESAEASYQAKRVIKTNNLIQMEKELQNDFEETISFLPKDSNDYVTAMYTFKKVREKNDMDAALLLEGAAEHKEVTFNSGRTIMIDEALISTVLTNLDSSIKRAQLLLDEQWTNTNV